MGDLWKAAVKSTKSFLYRIVQNRVITYEELNTILHRVETTLNSRPLCVKSSDPNDLNNLTAGNFLTMEPLVTIQTLQGPASLSTNSTKKRWSLIQQIHYHFWIRWYKEYLNTLQKLLNGIIQNATFS